MRQLLHVKHFGQNTNFKQVHFSLSVFVQAIILICSIGGLNATNGIFSFIVCVVWKTLPRYKAEILCAYQDGGRSEMPAAGRRVRGKTLFKLTGTADF